MSLISIPLLFIFLSLKLKIQTCIIDWESTTIRPLWHCAHLPSFLASDPTSPHADLFREIVAEMAASAEPQPAPRDSKLSNGDAQLHLDGSKENTSSIPNQVSNHVRRNGNSRRSEDVVPIKVDSDTLAQEAKRWLKGERERGPWRNAHRVVEWDGWEEGLVGMILHHMPPPEHNTGPLLVPQMAVN